jgi:protein-tyrosine-phosphatase
MKISRVLFVCTFSGARSLIAQKFTNQLAYGKIQAYSASFEFGKIGPLPIAVMKEIGIDLPTNAPKSVWDRYMEKETFDWVVTLRHEISGLQQCPIFKENVDDLYAENSKLLSWSVPPFSSLSGSDEDKKAGAPKIRDQIKREVSSFLGQIGIEANIAD